MKRNKLFAAGLFCSLLLTGITQANVSYVEAAPSLNASADTGSVSKGEYVNVDVNLGDNPSFSTLGASLGYDSSVLKYDSSTWNSGFSGNDMQMASDTGSEVNLSVVCDNSYEQDGTIVTVRFQAVKDADSIPVTLALRDMADANLGAVSDCTVASAVQAPQAENPPQDDIVDIENPDDTSDIQVVDEVEDPSETDENSGAGQTDSQSTPNTNTGDTSGADTPPQLTMTDSGSTESGSSAGTAESTSYTQQSGSSGLDANYKTGAGIGSDVYLVGAAVFGILALVLLVRRHRS